MDLGKETTNNIKDVMRNIYEELEKTRVLIGHVISEMSNNVGNSTNI